MCAPRPPPLGRDGSPAHCYSIARVNLIRRPGAPVVEGVPDETPHAGAPAGAHRRPVRFLRPQFGILLLAALAPYDGLLLIVPHGQSVHSWKEVLTLATLAATFVVRPDGRRRLGWRALPQWVVPLGGLVVVGLIWSIFVGVVQAETGFRIDFFYVLLAFAVWRAPLNLRERDWLVTILMVNGVVTALVGLAQQAVGDTRLHELGYAYNTVIRTSHGSCAPSPPSTNPSLLPTT